MSTEKSLVYYVPVKGNLSNLIEKEVSLPALKSNEVCICIRNIGLNFADIFAILGLYSATPKGGFVPGLEFSGIVEGVGHAVSHIAIGDRVMGVTRFGGYTNRLHIDARYVMKIPVLWSFEEGAAFPVQALTAYYALFTLGELKAGQTVLIHSAAGGVGLLANRMAKSVNAFTIGTVGRAEKIPLLRKEGYDATIVRSRNFSKDLREIHNGRNLHLVLDSIGGRIFKESFKALAPMGRIIVYGSAVYGSTGNRPNWIKILYTYLTRPRIDPQTMIQNNVSVLGFNLIWLYEEVDLMLNIFDNIAHMNLPSPYIGHKFSWYELPQALKLFQSGSTVGKIVVGVTI
ncbi:MAG TPA: zinc-binding dehydrogenase [Saprospiraceae bacterium]|nr:zinc-binding dehydrogenase [Saprospiraceae bacterium]